MREAHITVAAVVARDGPRNKEFLFVEESVGGRTVLNQPAGHWEAGETLLEAVKREALEETGWDIEPTALLGIYEYEPPELGYGFLRFAYLARPLRHHPDRALDPGIARAVWLAPDELRREQARHRSPMVQRCIDDALAGQHHPLSLIGHL
ncbi:MAG: NUDIX hydrolase [Gammaproteobacteria bacterium]